MTILLASITSHHAIAVFTWIQKIVGMQATRMDKCIKAGHLQMKLLLITYIETPKRDKQKDRLIQTENRQKRDGVRSVGKQSRLQRQLTDRLTETHRERSCILSIQIQIRTCRARLTNCPGALTKCQKAMRNRWDLRSCLNLLVCPLNVVVRRMLIAVLCMCCTCPGGIRNIPHAREVLLRQRWQSRQCAWSVIGHLGQHRHRMDTKSSLHRVAYLQLWPSDTFPGFPENLRTRISK